ncbi:MAG: dTDP-4-dehydrorhamnose 3,5-epimerase [Peptococcaceae bacterium BICA1-7]|nr:MAG: dTDP-4-dehydrorhamnose 3,5-epimerase [Peptococcaceae bacterium BICA1-7]HBV96295.1 dTDP-4-dehydrorhamnose 3,5-epimerase [Desulfotomaculum sp.]
MELIQGVQLRQLKIIPDERGFLMEMLRCDWPEFDRFAQSYVTMCYPGLYKAWHFHEKQWDHFVCISGMSRVVLYDSRTGSPTEGKLNIFHLGVLNPTLLKIPPLVHHGFTAEGNQPSMIINFPTELYDYANPDEIHFPWDDPSIPYNWELKDR